MERFAWSGHSCPRVFAAARQAGRSARSTQTKNNLLAGDDRQWIPLRELPLMPVGINRRHFAGAVQLSDVIRREIPSRRVQILPQLLFIARANDDGCHGRPLQQPVERHLWHALSARFRNLIQRVDNVLQMFV